MLRAKIKVVMFRENRENKVTKAQLRRKLLKARLSLSEQQWRTKSELISQQLQNCPYLINARTILAYFTFRQEPDLSSLFDLNHRWGFPRCVENSLVWHLWQPREPLETSKYGTLQPRKSAPRLNPKEIDLILVPALAMSFTRYRLGYGGGFYDRMLSSPEWSKIPKIGIVFDFAYLPEFPVDPWDQKLDGICTETFCRIHTESVF